MPRIVQECVERIKSSVDIVDLVGRYIQLRRAGNSWKACCPFHNEKTPSFHVNPARQTFKCFGCGVGGDGVKFLMMFENLDYPTALRRIADINGIPVIEEEENPEAARLRMLRSRIIQLNSLASSYFHRKLCRGKEAAHVREYLKQREFNIEIAKAWELGWAPPDYRELADLAATHGMDARLQVDAYLLGNGRSGAYPVFRDRLMFPIRNVRGEVVGFSGRIMQEGQDPRKYVNTAETAAFRKGELLFGLHKATGPIAKAGMCVVVCEGQLDVIACHEKADIRNAVAGLGTAFTDDHAKMLHKYASKAILCYDGDNAGIKASEKTFRKLAQVGMDVYQAALPPGEDPDSLIKHSGADALRQAIADAKPYLELRAGIELAAIQNANDRAALIPRMADLASEIADPTRRDVAVVDLATRLNTGLDDFRSIVNDIIRARKEDTRKDFRQQDEPSYLDYDDPEAQYGVQEEEPVRVVPIHIHPTILDIIKNAAGHKGMQELFVDRIEDLQEPIQKLSGGLILQRLMEKMPEPGNNEQWQEFIASLTPEQAAAMRAVSNAPLNIEGDLQAFVNSSCDVAVRAAIKADIDAIRARIFDASLTNAERAELGQRLTELTILLKEDAPADKKP